MWPSFRKTLIMSLEEKANSILPTLSTPQHSNSCCTFVPVEPNFYWIAVHCYSFDPIDQKFGMEVCYDILHFEASFQVSRVINVKKCDALLHFLIWTTWKIGIEACLDTVQVGVNLQIDRIKNVRKRSILMQVWFRGYQRTGSMVSGS